MQRATADARFVWRAGARDDRGRRGIDNGDREQAGITWMCSSCLRCLLRGLRWLMPKPLDQTNDRAGEQGEERQRAAV